MQDDTPTRGLSRKTRKIRISDQTFSADNSKAELSDTEDCLPSAMSTPVQVNRRQRPVASPFDRPMRATQETEIGWGSPDPHKQYLYSRTKGDKNSSTPEASPIAVPSWNDRKNLASKNQSARLKAKKKSEAVRDLEILEDLWKNAGKVSPKKGEVKEEMLSTPQKGSDRVTPKALFPKKSSTSDDSLDDLFNDSDVIRSTQAVEAQAYQQQTRDKRRPSDTDPPRAPKTIRMASPQKQPQFGTRAFSSRSIATSSSSKMKIKQEPTGTHCANSFGDDSEDFANIVATMDEEQFVGHCKSEPTDVDFPDVQDFENKTVKHPYTKSQELPKPVFSNADTWPDDDWFISEDVLTAVSQVEDSVSKSQTTSQPSVDKEKGKKCTESEIAKKRQLALAKRLQKSKQKSL